MPGLDHVAQCTLFADSTGVWNVPSMAMWELLRSLQLVAVHAGTILLLLVVYAVALLSVLAEQAEGVFHKVL